MRPLEPSAFQSSTEIDGSFTARSEENFRPHLFGAVAKLVWRKPDAAIATIAGVSDRAARDYLSGRVAAPAIVLAAMMVELARRP
jgi:hypothetical protein